MAATNAGASAMTALSFMMLPYSGSVRQICIIQHCFPAPYVPPQAFY